MLLSTLRDTRENPSQETQKNSKDDMGSFWLFFSRVFVGLYLGLGRKIIIFCHSVLKTHFVRLASVLTVGCRRPVQRSAHMYRGLFGCPNLLCFSLVSMQSISRMWHTLVPVSSAGSEWGRPLPHGFLQNYAFFAKTNAHN